MARRICVGALLVACVACVAAPTAAAKRHRSPLTWRAIVEGPYGRPWDSGQRMRVLRWMAGRRMNAYVHAPKEDLYQRTLWRDPYPAAEMNEFAAEVRFARRHRIQWVPNLSPALPLIPTPSTPSEPPSAPLCFSCPSDLDAVLAKLEPFRLAGARTFMISFDDVVKGLTDPRDVAAYGAGDEAFGRANGDFLTRLLGALRQRQPGVRLLTVGADYSGTADTDYLRGLRSTLAPEVGVMWTGTSVPATDFTAADARAYGEAIGRKPLLWDNWTNNDTAGNAIQPFGTVRIFLGPYHHRPEIAGAIGGIFLNPGNEADLNLLPFGTAADFMRAPRRYRPRRSWLRSVGELIGRRKGLRESLRAFAETSYSTKLGPTEAPTFARLAARLVEHYGGDARWPPALSALAREQRLVIGAPDRLARLPNHQFFVQAEPFLETARSAANTGLVAARLLGAERPDLRVHQVDRGFRGFAKPPDPSEADALRFRYKQGRFEFQTSRRFVYGWRLGFGFDIPPYDAAPNALELFLDAVDGFDMAFRGQADSASSSVQVTLAGRPVSLAADGSFRLARSACGRRLAATDGAGGRTVLRLPRCGP